MRLAVWTILMAITIVGFTYLGVWATRDENSIYIYAGQIEFKTQDDYSEFKRQVNQEGVRWYKMDVLSSDPPIIAHFEVAAPYGVTLDYGEVRKESALVGAIIGAFVVSATITVAVVGLDLKPKSESSRC